MEENKAISILFDKRWQDDAKLRASYVISQISMQQEGYPLSELEEM